MLGKKRRKELREIHERKKDAEFVEEIMKEPFISISEYIDLKMRYGVE